MKAVMISIQPKWCELIASGKKTVEVRKSAPKLETPFKCYIYCTKKARKDDLGDYVLYEDENGFVEENGVRFSPLRASRVIGEFVCDEIDEIAGFRLLNEPGFGYRPLYEAEEIPPEELEDKTCLDEYELENYLGFKGDGYVVGYAWHISELKIYDKPKELGEFTVAQHEYGGKQVMRSYGGWKVKRVTNWCYVEEI